MTKSIWKIYSVSSLALAVTALMGHANDFEIVAATRTCFAFVECLLVFFYAFDVRWTFPLSKKKTCVALIGFILVDLLWILIELYKIGDLGIPIFFVPLMLSIISYFNFTAIYRYGLAPDDIERHASHKPKSL